MLNEIRFRYEKTGSKSDTHGEHLGIIRIRKISPLWFTRFVCNQGFASPGATYQFKHFVEAHLRDDRIFNMLGENLGHDHGRRTASEHVIFFRDFWPWTARRRGNPIVCNDLLLRVFPRGLLVPGSCHRGFESVRHVTILTFTFDLKKHLDTAILHMV